MERLTKVGEDGYVYRINCEISDADAWNKLAHYEDLEEKGLLVELPCKVGDTVYAIVNKKIVEDVVDRIEINNLCKKISTVKHSWLCNFDNVFLTQSEAERALERQKNEK